MRSSPPSRRALGVALLLLLAFALPASAAVYEVQQSGFSFSPSPIIILPGDTVRWVWSAANHTVTSGTGSSDPQVGALFDDLLDSAHPTFEYTFSSVGTFPYFCRTHEAFNMKGTVIVDSPVGTQPSSWSQIKRLHEAPR